MAARKCLRHLGVAKHINSPASADDHLELDEADVWSVNDIVVLPETKKKLYLHPRPSRKPLRKSADVDRLPMGPKSLPVNIPEWSKILGSEFRRRVEEYEKEEEDEEDDDENDKIPPHEYLARIRGESFSVHDGVGRKLKGRDLRRVRNAIWKQIGFED